MLLQAIRDKLTGWIAWIIIILITIPFALWGIEEYLSETVKIYAAKVGNKEIAVAEYQQAYNRYREQMRRLFGASYTPDAAAEAAIRKNVLSSLIEHELLLQQAYNTGMRVGDAALAAQIHSIPAFQAANQFDLAQYQRLLAAQGLSVGQFEGQLRNDMVVDQLRNAIQTTSLMLDKVWQSVLNLQQQQREVQYITLTAGDKTAIAVNEPDIEAYYQAHLQQYKAPARAQFEYIELTTTALESQVKPDEAQLQALYEEALKTGRFTVEEQRKASHILVQVARDADAATVTAAEAKIKDLQARVTPANFAELAKTESADSTSAAQGGDLGYFGKGLMAAEFEAQAFSMAAGTMSAPIRTDFGFHLIYLTDIKPGHTKTLAEATPELEKQWRTQTAETQFFAQAEQLSTLVYENPDSLEAAAKTLGLAIKTTDWVAETGAPEGLFAHPKVLAAGFSDDVIAGNNSEVIEVASGQALALRIKAYEAAKPRPIEQVRADIVQKIQATKAKEALKSQADQLLKRLQAGESLAALAAELRLEVVQRELGRQAEDIDRLLREAIFRLPKPKAPALSYGQTALSSGDYALIALVRIIEDKAPDNAQETATQLQTRLTQEAAQAELEGFIATLRQQIPVVENPQAL